MPLRPYARATGASAATLKSPQAFRSISEVAEILKVPQHVLRFWESKFVQLKPLKRRGGRRYYRLSDIELLCGVHKLLYGDRYTIEGVQKVLAQRGIRFVTEIGRSALSISGEHIALTAEEQDSAQEAGEGGEQLPEQEEAMPSERTQEGQGARQLEDLEDLDDAARQRLLQALDTLEEIAAALQSEADAESESSEAESAPPGGETS